MSVESFDYSVFWKLQWQSLYKGIFDTLKRKTQSFKWVVCSSLLNSATGIGIVTGICSLSDTASSTLEFILHN